MNAPDKDGYTPLLSAVERNDSKLVAVLLTTEARAISECVTSWYHDACKHKQ